MAVSLTVCKPSRFIGDYAWASRGRAARSGRSDTIRYSSALGRIFYYARRYDESVRQYRHALELDPTDATVHEDLGDVYERLGLGREAIAEWCAAMTLAGDATTASVIRQGYDRGGLPAATHALARTKLQRFTAWTNRGVLVPAVEYARAYMRLGEREQALRSLAKACDEYTTFVLHINVDPIYDDLHHDSRFRELIKRLKIPS
jgi:tetratricopeptide (TPR) repeat protein